jgi:opacity protein-like surface antigen
MKKHMIMLAACCGMAFASQAQDATATGSTGDFKANGGDVTLEANLNLFNGASSNIGLNNGLNQVRLRYFLNDDMAIRLGFGFSSFSTDDSVSIPTGGRGFAESKSSSWSFSPGIEKHFAGTDRLSPYVGAELVFTGQSTSTNINGKNYKAEIEGADDTGTRDKTSFGLNAVGGVDWYVTRRLYLGFEVGLGFASEKEKDFTSSVSVTEDGVTVTTPDNEDGFRKNFNFGPNVRNSIRLGFAF